MTGKEREKRQPAVEATEKEAEIERLRFVIRARAFQPHATSMVLSLIAVRVFAGKRWAQILVDARGIHKI